MIVQFTTQRALFSLIFFVNCITLLILSKHLIISRSSIFRSIQNPSNGETNSSSVTPLRPYPSSESSKPPEAPAEDKTVEDKKAARECAFMDDLRKEGITVVMKTGSQEIINLAIHFATTLKCFQPEDILLFSDLDQYVGNFHAIDALRNVKESIKGQHQDFAIYRSIQHYNATGQDVNILKEDQKIGDSRSGWRLDKYKFLHMVEDAYAMRPAANWFVFLETDSYMFWPNVAKWLKRRDSSKAVYMGSPTALFDVKFAHGGSGYVISKAAMKNLMAGNEDHHLSAHWDEEIQGACCGDYGLGKALLDTGTPLSDAWPMCNGESPFTIPFGDEHWCQPVMTLHHNTPNDISQTWRFQRQWENANPHNENPILYKDIHDSYLLQPWPRTLNDWDNASNGPTYMPPDDPNPKPTTSDSDSSSDSDSTTARPELKSKTVDNPKTKTKRSNSAQDNAYKSWQFCFEACQADKDCFQYSFEEIAGRNGMGTCRLGARKFWSRGKVKEGGGWSSGWMLEKIEAWKGANGCANVAWVDR